MISIINELNGARKTKLILVNAWILSLVFVTIIQH